MGSPATNRRPQPRPQAGAQGGGPVSRARTLINMAYVASQFATSRRRELLSRSHHETLAALEPAEQNGRLDETERHGWSVEEFAVGGGTHPEVDESTVG